MIEKWKILESLLKDMATPQRHDYKYIGMNYSLNAANNRVRFEYIFRSPQTVWLSFSYYPESKSKPRSKSKSKYLFDRLDLHIISPFMIEGLDFNQWVTRYNSQIDLANFLQFDGDFSDQATLLVRRLDDALDKSGIGDVLSGRSGIDVPSMSLGV